MKNTSIELLNAGAAAIADNAIDWKSARSMDKGYVLINAASVTTGATVTIKTRDEDGNAFTVHSEAVTADGQSQPVELSGGFKELGIGIESYTDGTYDVTLTYAS